MTVLVVGATGTVGSEVVRQLRAAGVPVRAGTRDPGRVAAGPDDVPTVRLDVEDPTSWPAALDGVDAVFLLRPPQVARVSRMAPFVTAVAAAGVARVVLLSVQGADRNPLLPHRGLERLVEASGVAWTFLRPGYFLQNLLTVHREEVRDRSEVFVPAGDGRTAFVDTRDVAAVAVLALTSPGHEGRAYELTGAEALTYADVAAALSRATGRTVRYARPGALRYAVAQLRRRQPLPLVALTIVLYTAARIGRAAGRTDDLARVLGRPPTTLDQFALDHAAAWG